MTENRYIQVIVPLKLSWDPVYRVPDGFEVQVGSRVKVRISGRLVDAVVCAVGVRPEIEERRILPIAGICDGLDLVTAEEIALWRFISDYYMCTAGEVFKCAYPAAKVRSEETALRIRERAALSRARMQQALMTRIGRIEEEMRQMEEKAAAAIARLSERSVKTKERLIAARDERRAKLNARLTAAKEALDRFNCPSAGVREQVAQEPVEDNGGIRELLSADKPLLVKASSASRSAIYAGLIGSMLAEGKNVLMLVPEISLTEDYESGLHATFGEDRVLIFHSRETTTCRRKIAEAMRDPKGGKLVVGTRSALFLPISRLGLVIVDEEQDRSYKQDSPAPRYNARDCAVMLAKLHSAPAVLGSASPSLESGFNCIKGRYACLDRRTCSIPGEMLEIIDIPAEKRKRGMVGQYSRRLLSAIDEAVAAGRKVYLIRGWGDTFAAEEELRSLRPALHIVQFADGEEGQVSVATLSQTRYMLFKPGSVIALLQADPILGAQDFRADERACQIFERYRQNNPDGRFIIQTARAGHPIFKALTDGTSPYEALLSDRKAFGYPPYSRIIDIILNDTRATRLSTMSDSLYRHLILKLSPQPGIGGPLQINPPAGSAESGRYSIRVIIKRDALFSQRKNAIRKSVDEFTSMHAYGPFIHIDVDPD